jgi:L-rhamnose mutarotase
MSVQRMAAVIRLRPEKEAQYRAMHADTWPQVLRTLKEAGVSNYSIFLRDGMLFSYMEFDGDDFEASMENMASDEATKEWWMITGPCQQPLGTVTEEEWWAPAEEIFHLD